MTTKQNLRAVRAWLSVFIIGLLVSGITAFPLQTELAWSVTLMRNESVRPVALSIGLLLWLERVNDGITATNALYPFLAYGTDWLAFAHIVLAAAFIGPFRDPVRNKWVIDFGLIACAAVIPLAMIAGPIRGIPFPWRLVDCSFGIFGCLPLLRCRWLVSRLERTNQSVGSRPER
jgi:hypothetical protein